MYTMVVDFKCMRLLPATKRFINNAQLDVIRKGSWMVHKLPIRSAWKI